MADVPILNLGSDYSNEVMGLMEEGNEQCSNTVMGTYFLNNAIYLFDG